MALDARLRLLLLTDRQQSQGSLVEVVRQSVEAGVRAVLLREKDLGRCERMELFGQLDTVTQPAGCLLLGASTAPVDCAGIHLASGDPLPSHRPRILGRSCHSLQDVEAAHSEGCDYVTLSPIYLTTSKPGYGPPLGLDLLRTASTARDIPILALGGVGPREAAECLQVGAAGVAIMGAVMRSKDPAVLVKAIKAQLETAAYAKQPPVERLG